MQVRAHPMLVAVALGLLGPGVLESKKEEESETNCCGGNCGECGEEETAFQMEIAEQTYTVDPDEAARAEAEWLAVRALIPS